MQKSQRLEPRNLRGIQSRERDIVLVRYLPGHPHGVNPRPIPRRLLETFRIRGIVCRNVWVLGIPQVGRDTEHPLDREQHNFERECWGPLVRKHVEADGARRGADVRVVDFCEEFWLQAGVGVCFRKYDVLVCTLQLERCANDSEKDSQFRRYRPRMASSRARGTLPSSGTASCRAARS